MTAEDDFIPPPPGEHTLHSSRLLGIVLALRQAVKVGEDVATLAERNPTWPNATGLRDYGNRIVRHAVATEHMMIGEDEKIPDSYNASTEAMTAIAAYVNLLRRSGHRITTYSRRSEVDKAGTETLRDISRRLLEYANTVARLTGLTKADGTEVE